MLNLTRRLSLAWLAGSGSAASGLQLLRLLKPQ
jgi:hypothetical protein